MVAIKRNVNKKYSKKEIPKKEHSRGGGSSGFDTLLLSFSVSFLLLLISPKHSTLYFPLIAHIPQASSHSNETTILHLIFSRKSHWHNVTPQQL